MERVERVACSPVRELVRDLARVAGLVLALVFIVVVVMKSLLTFKEINADRAGISPKVG